MNNSFNQKSPTAALILYNFLLRTNQYLGADMRKRGEKIHKKL